MLVSKDLGSINGAQVSITIDDVLFITTQVVVDSTNATKSILVTISDPSDVEVFRQSFAKGAKVVRDLLGPERVAYLSGLKNDRRSVSHDISTQPRFSIEGR